MIDVMMVIYVLKDLIHQLLQDLSANLGSIVKIIMMDLFEE